MKRAVLFSLAAFILTFGAHAQLSARKLTRRIEPQLPPRPQPAQPARPAAPGVNPAAPAAAAVVPPKTAEQQADADKKLLDFQKARAEKGSDSAQYEMGMRYLTGKGVEKNEKTAKEWLEKSAAAGNSLAKKKLAELQPAEAKQK